MAQAEERPSRCSACGTPLGGGTTLDITLHEGGRFRTTALCADCAAVACGSCGSGVPITQALLNRGDIWEEHRLYDCGKCEESVLGSEIVELRNRKDPDYRKRICQECLQELTIPSHIRVVRDVH